MRSTRPPATMLSYRRRWTSGRRRGRSRRSSTRCARNATGASATSAICANSSGSRRGPEPAPSALNPLHELFPSNPRAASPYAPSSRLFLNSSTSTSRPFPTSRNRRDARARVAEPEFAAALQGLRTAALVDYEGVANAKLGVLRLLWESFRANHLERPGGARPSDFRTFVRAAATHSNGWRATRRSPNIFARSTPVVTAGCSGRRSTVRRTHRR